MLRKFFFLVIALLGILPSAAQNYTVYSLTKGVQVESGGKTVAASEGMALKPSDMLIIPSGGTVAIHDKASGDIYTSVSTGRVSVTKLKIEATRSASNKAGNILTGVNARFGSSKGTSGGRVYVEKGMVNRSLAVYDPDGDNVEMNTATLSRYIAAQLAARVSDSLPVPVNYGPKGDSGLFFRLENSLEYPVYFNVLRLRGNEVEISPLGQPNGTYVVLPSQSLQREHLASLPADEAHIIVLTPCQYDLDAVIEEINSHLKSADPVVSEDAAACVLFLTPASEI